MSLYVLFSRLITLYNWELETLQSLELSLESNGTRMKHDIEFQQAKLASSRAQRPMRPLDCRDKPL